MAFLSSRREEDLSRAASATSTASLLLGFFDFYGNEFDWKKEVLSVRLGERLGIDAECFRNFWGKGRRGFHVEDPIVAWQWEPPRLYCMYAFLFSFPLLIHLIHFAFCFLIPL